MTDDFFRSLLDQMIDLRHPLAVLAKRMPWQEIEAFLAQRWALQAAKTNGIELKQTLNKAKSLVTQSGSRKAVDYRAGLVWPDLCRCRCRRLQCAS